MTKTTWYIVAGIGALVVLWFLFVRKSEASALAPVGPSLPRVDGGGGILNDITSRFNQGKSLWDKVFGAPVATAASSSTSATVYA